MAGFQFASDVGQSSITAIQALSRSSGVTFSVTSSYRPGDPGYHGSSNAVDMATSATQMVKLASYLYQYSPYMLELIHSGGPGFFVKDGQRDYRYPSDIVAQHFSHVHAAMTLSGLRAASDGGMVIPADSVSTGTTAKGCLAPSAATTATVATGLIVLSFKIGEIASWLSL